MKQYEIEFLTPCACHGANKNAELRIPSIRGHLRQWHTILWGKEDMEYCWGAIKEGNGKNLAIASKVVLRIPSADLDNTSTALLPHKTGKDSVVSQCLKASQNFSLNVSYRYCKSEELPQIQARVEKTIELWLLLGTLGQRGTRAFGSVWNKKVSFTTPQEYINAVNAILEKEKYAVQLLKYNQCKSISEILKCCTDTIAGQPHLLGGIKPARKISPLKMKVIKINGEYYLVLHASRHDIIDNSIKLLADYDKPIGKHFSIVVTNK